MDRDRPVQARAVSLVGVLLLPVVAVSPFQSLSWSGMFVGTPLMSLYYRAMGAKVGRNSTIGTALCSAFDMVSIGEDTASELKPSSWATALRMAGYHR